MDTKWPIFRRNSILLRLSATGIIMILTCESVSILLRKLTAPTVTAARRSYGKVRRLWLIMGEVGQRVLDSTCFVEIYSCLLSLLKCKWSADTHLSAAYCFGSTCEEHVSSCPVSVLRGVSLHWFKTSLLFLMWVPVRGLLTILIVLFSNCKVREPHYET